MIGKTPSPRRSLLREGIFLLLLAALPALLTGWLHPKRPLWSWTKPGVTEVDLKDVALWPSPVLWVDARAEKDFQVRHPPGAIRVNEEEWDKLIPGFLTAWQPSAHVIVYCDAAACNASQAVALRLQRELSLTHIYVLRGGWSAWSAAHP